MPSTDQSPTEMATAPGVRIDGDALGEMQQRLAQLCRQIEEARVGLPDPQAGKLARIEEGIDGLSRRIAAFARERQSPAAAPTPRADLDAYNPWDPETAEALTRVHELAAAELWAPPQPRARRAPDPVAHMDDAARPDREAGHERAWLEQRFADIASVLARSLADIKPDRSLAALNQRLDQFEQRLEAALREIGHQPDTGTLSLVEAHIRELTSQFEAARNQLGRLDAIDEQLHDLAHMLEGRREQQPPAGDLSIETLKALIDTAAERAASQVAAALPPSAAARDEPDRARIEALEALLQDYVAERGRGEEVSAGILQTIEEALTRIVDRIDAMEAAKAEAHPASDADGLTMESERLAEAYAAGARVLGHGTPGSSLDAADYVQPTHHEEVEPVADAPAAGSPATGLPPPVPPGQDAEMRRELRASAMRAKLKAQAMPDMPPMTVSVAPDEVRPGPAKHARARAAAGSAGPRFSLLLVLAMATLFGTGYVAVDALLGGSTGAPGAEVARPGAQPAADRAPALQDPPKAGLAPAPDRVLQAPERQAELPADPDAARAGLAPTPVNLASEAPASAQAPIAQPLAGAALGVEVVPPAGVGSAALRQAAANGDPAAQFEVASRLADGKGVAADQAQAFAWFQRAAMRGHVPAQFRLGIQFERGIGVAADAERAKVWYRRAAEQGHARAMHNLAVLTVGGDQSDAGYAAAARWFTAAADRGLTDSQFNIGLLHEHGQGVAQSAQAACKWYALAARGGDKEAARRLERLKARLAPGELAAVERSLAGWHAQPLVRDAGG